MELDPGNKGREDPVALTADKIHHVQPNAKIIIIMRRPEDRLWSDYNFYPRRPHFNRTADDFHQKVVQGISWWRRCIRLYSIEKCAYGNTYSQIENPSTESAWDNDGAARVRISIYYAFVQRWLSAFPRENMIFLRFEDYVEQPVAYVNDVVLPFLGLEPLSNHSIYSINSKMSKIMDILMNKKSHKLPMRTDTKDLLTKFYEPSNKKLADILSDDKFLWKDV